MIKVLRLLILSGIIATFGFSFALQGTAYAVDEATKQAACEGLGSVGANCVEADANREVDSLVATIVNILSMVVGIASVIMIIIGGLRYILSNGDSNGISSAKNTILYALVGVVIALVAQGLVQFVLNKATTDPSPSQPSTGSPSSGGQTAPRAQ